MKLQHGYNYDSHFENYYEVIEDEGEAGIHIEINNLKTESGRCNRSGITIHMQDGKIVAFTIKSYEIELRIPATIEAHNAIEKTLNILLS